MPNFSYTICDVNGTVIRAEVEAASADALKRSLEKQGYLVRQIRKKNYFELKSARSRRPDMRSILSFLGELRAVINAGVPVNEALKILEHRPENPGLSQVLKALNDDVKRGRSLAEAIKARGDVFENDLAMSFQIGASSGDLQTALMRYESDLKLRLDLQKKLKKAIIYPTFLMVLLAVVLAILFLFILPNFIELYAEFDAALPLPTQILISLVESAPVWVSIWLGAILALVAAWRVMKKHPKGRIWLDRFVLRLPVWGAILKESLNVQMTSSLSLLLYSGQSVNRAVKILKDNIANRFLAQKLERVEKDLATGARFSQLVEREELFAPTIYGLLRAGERSGSLERMFEQAAMLHKERLGARIDFLEALLEPIMMAIIGGVIGLIVIVVYLPIFGVVDVV